jgi:hypothetical protein
LLAFELVGPPKQRAEDVDTVIAGEVDDAGFDHEAAEFDEVPRALVRRACQVRMSCWARTASWRLRAVWKR